MSRWERAVLGMLRAPTYPITVVGTEDVTDHYRRIHVEAPELLARQDTPPAFWLRLWIPYQGQDYQRAYTVTDVGRDQGRFTLEFALHDEGGGPGTEWARAATRGAVLRATVYAGKRFAVPDPAPAGYLLVEITQTLVRGRLPGTLQLGDEPVPRQVHHAADASGQPLVLAATDAELLVPPGPGPGPSVPAPVVLAVDDVPPVADHHADQVASYFRFLLAVAGVPCCRQPPRAVRLDRYGFVVDLGEPRPVAAGRWMRLDFSHPVHCRHELAHLLHPVLFHRTTSA